jgi:hypothetical protein
MLFISDVTPPSAGGGATSELNEASTADQAVQNENVENEKKTSTEKAEPELLCLVCDFKSNW